jgi:hypothetical protein
MSEELKNKLYNYEVDPPGTAWPRLAAILDDENSLLTQKLYNLEIPPPNGAWVGVQQALEEVNPENYDARLYNFEVAPPSDTWEKILDELDTERTPPTINPVRRFSPFIKYAIAACLVGVIAFVAFQFLKTRTGHSVANVTVLPPKSPDTIKPAEQKNSVSQETVISNNLPKEGISKTNNPQRKKTFLQQTGYMTQLANPMIADVNSQASENFQQAVLRGEVPGNCALISETDPYMTFMNPEGYLIRISKKLAETLGCVYTNKSSQDDSPCESQINEWRNKIAQSPVNSSTDNFMDVLNIVKSTQNN